MTARWVVLALILISHFPVAAQKTSSIQPYKALDLHKLYSAEQESTPSVEFLSDNSVALCTHAKEGGCLISVISWDGDEIHSSGSTLATKENLIGRAGVDHICATSLAYPTSSIYSIRSQTLRSIPFIRRDLASTSGRLAASSSDKNWTLYALVPETQRIRDGNGMLLAVSDKNLVIRRDNTINIETVNGNMLGSFRVEPLTKCFTEGVLLENALFLQSCKDNYIVSWSGKRLVKLQSGPGSVRSMGTDENGTRLLLDYLTRSVSDFQSAAELAVTVASGGVGAPDQFDNGETVRIFDTKTGAVCFQWRTSLSQTDAFFSHASIAPSGNFVAVARPATVLIFRVPESCKPH